MTVTASKLRENVYKILDQVIEQGALVEIERKGRRVRLVPVETDHPLDRLPQRDDVFNCDPDELIHMDWSSEWRP